jgi:hypothetical protein
MGALLLMDLRASVFIPDLWQPSKLVRRSLGCGDAAGKILLKLVAGPAERFLFPAERFPGHRPSLLRREFLHRKRRPGTEFPSV